jgi:UDP-N-acetyl-D-mannosaminuronate dehydrogenase
VSYIVAATEAVKRSLRRGQAIILESTTYPGTTREILLPALESTGLTVGEDFFLAFSPERVDPGNPVYGTRNTPKVVGGITEDCRRVAVALYQPAIDTLVPVSTTEAAELVKLLENTFRSVNIGLVNEMAIVCDKLGVAYKRDIDDIRESPALDILRLLEGQGARVSYSDSHVPVFSEDGHEFRSVPLTPETVAAADCVMIVTNHSDVDYGMIKRTARLVVDTRNALPKED